MHIWLRVGVNTRVLAPRVHKVQTYLGDECALATTVKCDGDICAAAHEVNATRATIQTRYKVQTHDGLSDI